LLARGHVDDGEPAMAQTDAGLVVNAATVWATVMLAFVHPLQDRRRDGPLTDAIENTDDAAHGVISDEPN
jgi:hypothetical protein